MTALLLPADGCPRCLTAEPVHPYRVDRYGPLGSISADYECPDCHFEWWTGWSEDAATLPCSGCGECSPNEASA